MLAPVNIRLGDLAERLNGELIGDADVMVSGIAPLDQADLASITFLSNPKLRNHAAESLAAAIILKRDDAQWLQAIQAQPAANGQSRFSGVLIVKRCGCCV